MAEESQTEMLERYRAEAARMEATLQRATVLAQSADPTQSALGKQRMAVWDREVRLWTEGILRLERNIAAHAAKP
jgi:hypothetical protein